jgi:hypothetical protein
MKDMKKKTCFSPADILLPDFSVTDGTAWSCVACDQYTSQPDYWEDADRQVGEAPSTLRLILPEAWLDEAEQRTPAIHRAMEDYVRQVLINHPDSMILLERTLGDGSVRRGLIGLIDLEEYDYRRGASSLIRATEQTVPERIPPRMAVRRDALLELPHVMMLMDDRERTVIEPLLPGVNALPVAYDYDLMGGGGHVKGYWLDGAAMGRVQEAMENLITPEAMELRYGKPGLAPLLFAVGDGNHSLAAAKACYEEVKASLGASAANHPARYALVEVVNLYDESLVFEPIYRVAFGVNPEELVSAFHAYARSLSGEAAPQTVHWQYGAGEDMRCGDVTVAHPVCGLAVGTVQDFLDEYMKTAPAGAYTDYIHGEDTVLSLSQRPGAVAFLYEGMAKEELFSTVLSDGALPRKTFSMGHAHDKRYYTEARKIR